MKRRFVNLERTDENIADQYPDIFDGLQKDAIQNAWDARLTKKGKDWKIVFKYNPNYNALIIEDYGTAGMNQEKWERYQGLWHTEKLGTSDAGSRGQGKFLFHYFSKDKLVLTETIDEKEVYRFSYGTPQEYDDETKTLSDFIPSIPKLAHQGTKIWILNIKEEFKRDLLNIEKFSSFIAASWWEIIQDYNAMIIVNFDGVEKTVTLPLLPKVKKQKPYQKERIEALGEIRNLILNYCDEEIPLLFQGIAVQRAGMTILRIPVKADETLKKRIYGYCNFDDQLEAELKKCELPNHMGFTVKRAWNHIREFIERKLENFILEITPKREKIVTDQKVLDEAAKLINKLVDEYAPELSKGEGPTRTASKIYIESFSPSERKIDFGDKIKIFCKIANETQKRARVALSIKIFNYQSRINKFSNDFNVILENSAKRDIKIPQLNFVETKDESGRYIAEAILRDKKKVMDRRRFDFYVNEEPPTKVLKPIRIESFRPEERKIDYGETLIVDCGIVNETQNKEDLIFITKIYHETSGDIKYSEKLKFELNGLSRKTIDIPLIDFDEKKDKPGKYIGEAILKFQKTSEEIDNKRFIFYVHEEPPKGKAFISKFIMVFGKGYFFERWRNLPRSEKGIVHIIWDHPEFVRLREQAKSKKTEGKEVMLYCTKCGADEAMNRLLEIRYNEKKLTSDELKEIRRVHNELIYGSHISIF